MSKTDKEFNLYVEFDELIGNFFDDDYIKGEVIELLISRELRKEHEA